ncbi:hypothetical protein [Sphingorhabdus sp.]|uniref:hypothetical protein n=1 Tax=Sphingorhabdus sp. TaxID=1902408 RepID=UPI00391D89E7
MKQGLLLALTVLVLTGCNNTPTAPEPKSSDASASNQQEELAKQKLTIEQAAEEATKLIEADAKTEIEAVTPITPEPAQ